VHHVGAHKSMACKALTKFSPGTWFVLRSLHFIANRLWDLSIHEPEQQESMGLGIDRSPLTLAWVDFISEARQQAQTWCVGEYELDLSRENAYDFGVL
jgi:hypothetical protein